MSEHTGREHTGPDGAGQWGHVVVIGAGVSGLLTARALSETFRRVTLVERDEVTGDTEYRNGVPQARHAHVLLARGGMIMEALFPGLRAELGEAGAPVYDLNGEGRFLFITGWAPPGDIGVTVQSFTRAALERSIRRRVLALPNVTLTSGFGVEGLTWGVAGNQVTGVRGPGGRVLTADLVVNASGRRGALDTWLADASVPVPVPDVVDGAAVYTSRLYEVPDGIRWKIIGEGTHAPHLRRGGVITMAERGRVMVSLLGAAGETAPTDEAGFLAYARTLRNPHFAEVITAGAPVGPVYRMHRLDNRWRPYHRSPRWPARLVCVGDAFCALNPIYGQGMTVAATQAERLREVFARPGDLTTLARVFQTRAGADLRQPWLIATSSDLRFSDTPAPVTTRLTRWYLDKVTRAVPGDVEVLRRFFHAAQLVSGPAVLLHPRVLARVAGECAFPRPPHTGAQ